MAHQHYRSPFGDTTLTKVFVGGLAWETPSDVMRSYFQQFGEILEAVIILDKNTGKSKGYGFVTFRDPESARSACADPNPVIDGRRANCNIASLGRPRPSPPRGRNQARNLSQGSSLTPPGGSPSYHSLPPPPPAIFPPYGYATFPHEYGYHQYYNQAVYGGSPSSPSSAVSSPYYYGYSMQPQRRSLSISPVHRFQPPPYIYYPMQVERPSTTFPPPPRPPLLQPPPAFLFPTPTDRGGPPQTTSIENEGGATTSSSTA